LTFIGRAKEQRFVSERDVRERGACEVGKGTSLLAANCLMCEPPSVEIVTRG
jgi:hypothetical protein